VTNYQTSVTQGQLDTAYNYQRDGLGRLTGLTWGANTLVSNVVYGAAGQLQQMVYNDTSIGGGFTETRTYNTNLQLTQIAATPTSGTGMHSIDPSIRPDANGNWTNTQQFSTKLRKDCFSGKDNRN
jgi:hypothetical protein